MKRQVCWLGALLLGLSGAAGAEVSSTITLTSDYDFRGITQTEQDPALQVSLDWSHESGLYAGLWGSNVDFGDGTDSNVEVDITGGYGGTITEGLDYDVGITYYTYHPTGDDIDYAEIYAGLTYDIVSTKLWYAPDYVNSSDSAWYAEGNIDYPLPKEFGLLVHVGYSSGQYWDDSNGVDSYYDWAVGVTRSFGHFDAELKWADGSNLSELDGTPDNANSSEGRIILSVSTTFPWSDK